MAAAPALRARYAVVGGGIVGLATARHLLHRGLGPVVVLEAGPHLAQHQTSHNSGVVHAGLYYRPGSAKARLCVEGHAAALQYARAHRLPLLESGKLVVAADHAERPALRRLFDNARANGVPDLRWLDSPAEVRDAEPDVAGVAAVLSPHTAVVSWHAFAAAFARDVRSAGGTVFVAARVDGVRPAATELHLQVTSSAPTTAVSVSADPVAASGAVEHSAKPQDQPAGSSTVAVDDRRSASVSADNRSAAATPAAADSAATGTATATAASEQHLPPGRHAVIVDRVITCAGVESDRLSRRLGGAAEPPIIPILGDYLEVTRPDIVSRLRTNIYPVPPMPDPHPADPAKAGESPPFLGVHYTPSLCGRLFVGPSAVPAAGRYAYALRDLDVRDVASTLLTPALWRFARRHPRFALAEVRRALVMSTAVEAARRYVPALQPRDFVRAPEWKRGIRAHAIAADGKLVDDFVFETVAGGRILNVRNAPSPAATASLAIARVIVERSLEEAT